MKWFLTKSPVAMLCQQVTPINMWDEQVATTPSKDKINPNNVPLTALKKPVPTYPEILYEPT